MGKKENEMAQEKERPAGSQSLFRGLMLIEILSNLPYDQICIRLADPNRAALIQPAVQSEPEEEICALLMPMRINY